MTALRFAALGILGAAMLTAACSQFEYQRLGAPCTSDGDCPPASVCDLNLSRCIAAFSASHDVLDLDATDAPGDGDVVDTVDTCQCAPGQVCCGDACVDLASDREHCGACGAVCNAGEQCEAARCICEAPAGVQARPCNVLAGETCCEGAGCVELVDSPQACGACGLSCNPGEQCGSALCGCGDGLPCSTGSVCCGGACCGTGELCCNGACFPPSAPECQCGAGGPCAATELCCPADGAEACINPRTDLGHCGACEAACGANQLCAGGGVRMRRWLRGLRQRPQQRL